MAGLAVGGTITMNVFMAGWVICNIYVLYEAHTFIVLN